MIETSFRNNIEDKNKPKKINSIPKYYIDHLLIPSNNNIVSSSTSSYSTMSPSEQTTRKGSEQQQPTFKEQLDRAAHEARHPGAKDEGAQPSLVEKGAFMRPLLAIA